MKPDFITKSKYVTFTLCKRKAWLDEFRQIKSEDTKQSIEGTKLGIFARNLFGPNFFLAEDCNYLNSPIKLNEHDIYAELPIQYDKLKCRCDIVKYNDDGSIDIYEVKSVTNFKDNKEKFLEDCSFQYYVAKKVGFNIKSINLVYLNKEYIYDGKYDLNKMFIITNLTDEVITRLDIVENNIKEYFEMDSDNEFNFKFSSLCKKCQYFETCKKFKKIPEKNSVFNLNNVKKIPTMIEEGILSYEQLISSKYFDELNTFNKRLINFKLNNINETYVDKIVLNNFLNKIQFPIYFFDFETVDEAIPRYKNGRPFQQIPFQYSLHIMNSKESKLEEVRKNHFEFLGNGKDDPREELIKQMLNDLGDKGTIIAYSISFETSRIKELARDFPEYANQLYSLIDRFVDLIEVFGYYTKTNNSDFTSIVYKKEIGSKTSIKSVLPAFHPEYSYDTLKDVHNGTEASEAYLRLRDLTGKEREELIKNMLKYCCKDTEAMVLLYFDLLELNK